MPALIEFETPRLILRIGMRDTGQDFEHAGIPEGHVQRLHCLCRITRAQWQAENE
jgi:hypothetical protein